MFSRKIIDTNACTPIQRKWVVFIIDHENVLDISILRWLVANCGHQCTIVGVSVLEVLQSIKLIVPIESCYQSVSSRLRVYYQSFWKKWEITMVPMAECTKLRSFSRPCHAPNVWVPYLRSTAVERGMSNGDQQHGPRAAMIPWIHQIFKWVCAKP